MPKGEKREGFLNVLRLARQVGGHHAVLVGIGVEPREISFGMELTPEVKGMVLTVIEAVFEELEGCAIMAAKEWVDQERR